MIEPSRNGAVRVSMLAFAFGCLLVWAVIANVNPYAGLNIVYAVAASSPVYLMGVLTAIWHLRWVSRRSGLAWATLILNAMPLAFIACIIALMLGRVITGNWHLEH